MLGLIKRYLLTPKGGRSDSENTSLDFLTRYLDPGSTPLVTNSLEMKQFVKKYPNLIGNDEGFTGGNYSSISGLSSYSLDEFDRKVTDLEFLKNVTNSVSDYKVYEYKSLPSS